MTKQPQLTAARWPPNAKVLEAASFKFRKETAGDIFPRINSKTSLVTISVSARGRDRVAPGAAKSFFVLKIGFQINSTFNLFF